ncbi:hypothetical protein BWI15_19415 [Kribbella sp. ALI-6-A]|uniref:hypothetical protein n=1 Tax=Kribbella sp. ALI-6-A TaxID=1933817 RepID=UPI00097C9CC3|nr:hypothetical protein [Kribbella sp. ALI-6-A]ONI72232.1 hypothetical protein BWI15_19415 [Kribbella sp. ALI-6-A]
MQWLLRTSAWIVGLLVGVPFAIAIFVVTKVSGDTTPAALGFGAASGLLVGATVALGSRKPRGEMRQVLEALPADDWAAARTATWRGAVPTRPDIRATALQLVDLRLDRLKRFRKWVIAVFGFNLAVAVVNIAIGRWWSILAALAWAGVLIDQWHAPRRLRRRRELLTSE